MKWFNDYIKYTTAFYPWWFILFGVSNVIYCVHKSFSNILKELENYRRNFYQDQIVVAVNTNNSIYYQCSNNVKQSVTEPPIRLETKYEKSH